MTPPTKGRWSSRLAAVLVAMPVVAVAVFFVWQTADGGPSTGRFLDHYLNGDYEKALVEIRNVEANDYRVILYRAAAYARLDRIAEARRAFDELPSRGFELPPDVRRDLIERYDMAPMIVDAILEGLARADLP